MNLKTFVESIKETVSFKEHILKDNVRVKAYYDKATKHNIFVANNKYYYVLWGEINAN